MAGTIEADGGSDILVSVVIPTYNRARLLREAIESLWRQSFPRDRFEIIVVDDCSGEGAESMLDELAKRSPVRLICHRNLSNQGPARSRNIGVRLARGEVIAFIDDDCRVDAEWLARGLAAFGPGVALVSGVTLDKPEQPVRFFSRSNASGLGENPTYPACNVFYRRDTYLEMGGMDETLYFRGLDRTFRECADSDLAWRVKKKGYASVFVPDLLVYHEVEGLSFSRWLLSPLQIFVAPALVKRHPELRRRLLVWRIFFSSENPPFYLATLGLVLGLLAHPILFVLVLSFPWRHRKLLAHRLSLARMPHLVAKLLLLGVHRAALSAGLIYGSLRFRCLVL